MRTTVIYTVCHKSTGRFLTQGRQPLADSLMNAGWYATEREAREVKDSVKGDFEVIRHTITEERML